MTNPQSPLDRAKDFFRGLKPSRSGTKKPGPKVRRVSPEKEPPKPETAKKKRTVRSEARESMEAVVVAFILAFLFRTFEAEAFVIPTGSMAPTLLGRNKETYCPQCGQHIVVGASDEITQETGRLKQGGRVDSAICPNCRFEVSLKGLPVFTGDRILVTKFPYEMAEPDRWDVIVFKYPQDPQTNYIKRLVGLPGEEIQISQGDVYVRKTDNGKWQTLRKDDPGKQRELQILVYDNDHQERGLHKHGWPKRWAAMANTGTGDNRPENGLFAGWAEDAAGWQAETEGRSFRLPAEKAGDGEWRWLRYRHIVPDADDWREWEQAEQQGGQAQLKPWQRLQLITDFCGYNAFNGGNQSDQGVGYYWVGDLTLNCRVQVQSNAGGELLLELNEGPRQYRCRFDLSTGQATLFHPDANSKEEKDLIELGTAPTHLKGTGVYDLAFSNVDNRLCLWVNGELIDFGKNEEGNANAEYTPHGGENVRQAPNNRDLIPVGIAAKGASVTVFQLKLERDIYYRGESVVDFRSLDEDRDNNGVEDVDENSIRTRSESNGSPMDLLKNASNPEEWYKSYTGAKNNQGDVEPWDPTVRFDRLGEGEYFVLGDNSPRSKDSRLWTPHRPGPAWLNWGWAENAHSVPREALVGKAFYIYWPHGKPFLNDGHGFPLTYHKDPQGQRTDYPSFRFPFHPDFGRMERIR